MPDSRVLDDPVWSALTGRQSSLAIGRGGALRFDPDYGPFATIADRSDESLAALAELAGDGEIWLIELDPAPPPPGMIVVRNAACLQMIASSVVAGTHDHSFDDLADPDAAEMLALAMLTAPGPFHAKTNRLGGFIGMRQSGTLVAMTGERMRPGNFTEVSGVCTHPDHRGRGYAGFLMRVVAARILARGETPFLQTYASNTGAIALYESLGFRRHQTVTLTTLRRQP